MKPWFYNEQSITEFKEPVVYKGLDINVRKTNVKPPYIATVKSPATGKEVIQRGGDTEQEALDSAKQAVDKREADAPKISAGGQTSVLLNTPSNDELLKDPSMYNMIYAKISKDRNGPTLVIGNEIYDRKDLEADGFVGSYDRRTKRGKDSEATLPQVMFNANNKLLSQIGIKMNGRYTLDTEGKYRDDNEHTVYPLQFQGSTVHAGDRLRMAKPALTIGATREDAQPWFEKEIKEADIIKFPEPERKVIKMPSVSEYPDFITGVLDLQARRDKGQIGQDSYDNLYQDLIQRFMKRESFDTPWFLREAEPQDIQALAKRVGNLPADVSDRIISKIQSALVLARKQATAKDKDPKGKSGEMNRFKRTSGALSKVKDPDMQAEYGDVARAMLGNDLTDKEIAQIIRSIAQNKCVNMSALKSSASDLSKIIPTYDLSTETQNYYKSVFRMTKYGVGAGEILFSTHSKDLYKGGKGDLTVVGTEQEIELKGGQSKPGRFVDQDTKPSPQYFSKAQAFVKKYNKIIKGPASGFKFTDIHSAIIDNSNANVKSQLLSDFRSVVAELFPNDAKVVSTITTAMAKPSLDITKLTQFYGAALVRRYFEAKKGGMGILFLRFKTDPPSTNYAESLEALQKFATIQPNSQGYVISTEARNVFPQTDVIITQ